MERDVRGEVCPGNDDCRLGGEEVGCGGGRTGGSRRANWDEKVEDGEEKVLRADDGAREGDRRSDADIGAWMRGRIDRWDAITFNSRCVEAAGAVRLYQINRYPMSFVFLDLKPPGERTCPEP